MEANLRPELEEFKQNLTGGYYSLYRTRSNDDHARHLHPKYDDYGSFGYWAKKLWSLAPRELKETRSTITAKNVIKKVSASLPVMLQSHTKFSN